MNRSISLESWSPLADKTQTVTNRTPDRVQIEVPDVGSLSFQRSSYSLSEGTSEIVTLVIVGRKGYRVSRILLDLPL